MMQDYAKELAAIRDLLQGHPDGMSVTDIARSLGRNKNTTGRYLDVLLIAGQVEMRTFGMAKVYTLAKRMPLAAIISCTRDLIVALDTDLRIREINESFLSLIGLGRAAAIGKNIAHLAVPDVSISDLLSTLTNRLSRKDSMVSLPEAGGTERVFRQHNIPTVFPDGEKGTTVLLQDVTALVQADRKIRERELRFRLMAENIRDGLIIVENEKIVFGNRSVMEITGYSAEELAALDPASIVAPEEREQLKSTIEERVDGHHPPVEFQVGIIRKDGNRREVYGRSTVMEHEGRRYIFLILTDISELCRKDRELAASEQRFRLMAESIQDGLIIIEDGRIVFSNRRVAEITGYGADELMRMESLDLVSPDDRRELMRQFDVAVINPGYTTEFKTWVVRKDAGRRYLSAKLSSAPHDKTVSIYLVITDITEFARREEALRERIASLQELVR